MSTRLLPHAGLVDGQEVVVVMFIVAPEKQALGGAQARARLSVC